MISRAQSLKVAALHLLAVLAVLLVCAALSGCAADVPLWSRCAHHPRHVVDLSMPAALYGLGMMALGYATGLATRWFQR